MDNSANYSVSPIQNQNQINIDDGGSPNDPFYKLIEHQAKLFEEFGKRMSLELQTSYQESLKQQTNVFEGYSKQLGLGLQTLYQEYFKRQNEINKKNSVEIEQVCKKYEEKIDHLKSDIDKLRHETNVLRKNMQSILGQDNHSFGETAIEAVERSGIVIANRPEKPGREELQRFQQETKDTTKDIQSILGHNNSHSIGGTEAAERCIAKRSEKPGTVGREVELKSNFIAVSKFNYPIVYYYAFKAIDPNGRIVSKNNLSRAFEQMRLKNFFGINVLPVYDGSSVYSATRLAIGHSKETRNYEVIIPLDANSSGHVKKLKVEIKFLGEIRLLLEKGLGHGQFQHILTVLNAFANYKLRSEFLSVGKKAIFPPTRDNRPILLSGGVEMKHGFYQSIRLGREKLVINVGTSATTFYPAGPIIDIIPKIIKNKHDKYEKTSDDLRRGLEKEDIDNLNMFLRGVKIFITHISDNRKAYKVSFVDKQSADETKFKIENREITVAQYFKETYKKPLQYSQLPCVIIINPDKSGTPLPLEVCEICPGQKYEGLVNDDARREMVQKTAVKPSERFDRIGTAIREIFQHEKDENLRSIGMDVDPEFIKVKGHVLAPPKLITRGAEIIPDRGSWNLGKFIKSPDIYNWSVMVFESKNYCPQELVKYAIIQLRNSLSKRGMNVLTEPPIEYANPQGDYDTSLSLALQSAWIVKEKPPQLIVCIIPKKIMGPAGIYASIKRICGTQLGVISQCIVGHNMRTKLWKQICNNISLKINGKLGGINCALVDGELNFGTNLPYMVIGAHVSHPNIKDKGRPSVAAICASMDKSVTKCVGRYSINRTIRNEVIENLEGMMVELLNQFQQENKILPFQIVFYRDFVAEGQFEYIFHEEVTALKRAFNRVYNEKDKKPQLTFIITQKSNLARFIPNKKEDSDRNGNCQPGTIVDTGILIPQTFDFYLQSHASPFGTACPMHYQVLLNEANFSTDAMQTLTYKLCHLSARCSLTISHVTPVRYAYHIANQAKHFVTPLDGSIGGYRKSYTVPNTTKCEKVNSLIENTMFFI